MLFGMFDESKEQSVLSGFVTDWMRWDDVGWWDMCWYALVDRGKLSVPNSRQVLLTLPPKFLSDLRSLASSPRFNRAKLQVQLQDRAKMQPPTITFLEVSLLRGGCLECPLDLSLSYVSGSLTEPSFLRSCNMERM